MSARELWEFLWEALGRHIIFRHPDNMVQTFGLVNGVRGHRRVHLPYRKLPSESFRVHVCGVSRDHPRLCRKVCWLGIVIWPYVLASGELAVLRVLWCVAEFIRLEAIPPCFLAVSNRPVRRSQWLRASMGAGMSGRLAW